MTILPFFAFLSGILTILSPCILPVLPIVLSGSIGGKRKPFGIVVGFIGSFSLFTLILSSLVQLLRIPPDTLRFAAVAIILGFGVILLFPGLQEKFELAASRMIRRQNKTVKTGFIGGLSIGTSLGLVWTPCVGPIMASVISLAVSQRIDGGAVLIIVSYSLGTAIPMLAIMLGGRKLIQQFPGLSKNTGKLQRGFGVIMIAAALSIGFGLDRQFQTKILELFPRYGTGLTSIENTQSVEQALNQRSQGDRQQMDWSRPPENGKLKNYGSAPELITRGKWFNSEGLNMEDLKGKVVIIDFWTYSCINCVRTLPFLQKWYETYKDQGLVIIGVHSPEFAFERNPENVKQAISDLNVTWPVVLDNDFSQWHSYNNRYWPAHYFIDSEGNIRYFHFGEGEYETSEKVIRELLKESGAKVAGKIENPEWEGISSKTPEIYLGFGRTKGFLKSILEENEENTVFTIPGKPDNGKWGLEGNWKIRREYIESSGEGTLELGFYSSDVFLVIEPVSHGSSIDIFLDGIKQDPILPDQSRVYKLIEKEKADSHLLRLEVKGNVRLYAFTFG